MRSTAPTIAARPDASLWLTVTLGPRKRCSRPARLAAALATVLSKSSAGAPDGPLRNSASRNCCVDPPPAVHVPSTTPMRSSPSGGDRHAGIVERQLRRGDGVDAGAIHAAQLHRRNPRRRIEAGDLGRERRPAAARVEAGDGAMPVRPSSSASRNAACDVPNADTTPMPDTRTGRRTRAVRYHCFDERSTPRPRSHALAASSPLVLRRCCSGRAAADAVQRAPPAESFDELYLRAASARTRRSKR